MIALSLIVPPLLPELAANATMTIIMSMAGTVVYAFTIADIDGAPASEAWLRAFERAWAAIVVDFLEFSAINRGGKALIHTSFQDGLLAGVLFVIALGINFADVDAVVNDDDRWWLLVPTALLRSIRVTWSNGPVMLRAVALFLIGFITGFMDVPMWIGIIVSGLLFVPIAVLTTHVYLDAIGYESKRSCNE